MARKRRSLDTPNDEPIQLSATHNSLGKRGRSTEDEDDIALIQKKRKVTDERRQKVLRGSSSDGAIGAGTLRRSLRKRGRTVDEEAGQALMREIKVDETLLVTGESGQAASPKPNSSSKRSLDPAEKDHEDSITKKQKVATPECTDEGWEEASSPATLLPPPSVSGLGSSFPEPSSSLETQPQPESESGNVESVAALSPAPTIEAPSLSRNIFPFMNLPAELRLHIYRAALHRDEPLLLHADRPELNEEKAGVAEGYRRSDIYATLRRRRSQQQDSQELSPPTQQASQQNPQQAYQQQRQSDLAEYGIAIPDPERDLIVPALLRLNSGIYKECQPVLYSENTFILSLGSGIHTLSTLHQRSRSLIKSVSLTIPSHHDILDGFADLVRLGLRYCWGLKKFTIILQASLPDDRMLSGATSVYANAFHILRWLPKGCKVVLEGNVSEIVRRVVAEEGRLQETLDDTSYLKRQHQMPERH